MSVGCFRTRLVPVKWYLEMCKTNFLAARLVKEFTMNCQQIRCLNEAYRYSREAFMRGSS